MNHQQCQILFERFAAQNPNPTTELHFSTPYELLVGVILSAQTTDKRVNQVTAHLFPVANTPEAMLKLGLMGLKHHIRSIGLFNAKAKHIIAMSEQLLEKHAGAVPSDREALQALPGVGRKTANVVLNTLFGQETIAIDTHIFRVANRTGLGYGKTVWQVEQALLKRIPKPFLKNANHWLVLHGRYTCTARRPKCDTCLIRDLCENPVIN